MSRFEDKTSPALYLAIVISLVVVFFADLYTPLGIAVWIVYLIPQVLSFWSWRPQLPLAVALVATAFMTIAFFTSIPGIEIRFVRINRSLGVLTICIIAVVGWMFIRAKLAVRRADWLQTGQRQLSERLIGEQGVAQLADNAIGFLCTFLNAQAGAIFVEEGKGFRRAATFAVPAGSVPEGFGPSEGLLGQVAWEARTRVVNDVPEGYLAIGSALGRALPHHLLIAPALVDNRVNAVLELGFFQPVDETGIELLNRVGSSIGVAIRSAVYRKRMQELLEETQQRAELEQTNLQLEEQTRLLEMQQDELKAKQSALEERSAALQTASRYKSDFLANMSHELRTPLNSSLILAKLLADNRDGNLTEEQVQYAQTIQSAGSDLLSLINDVLDLSKVEAGRLDLRREPVRIAQVVENLQRTFEPLAVQKGLGLRVRIAEGTPESLETDPQRLEQVLRNLLSNAVKFTEGGEVQLEVSRAGEDRVAFAVRDTGIGIAPDQHVMIFEPFCQADGTTVRRYGGTGLGLSISRELVLLLGGEIQLQSEVGRGSTFTVILPLAPASGSPPPAPPRAPRAARESAPPAPSPGDENSAANPPARTPRSAPPGVADDRDQLIRGRRLLLIVEDDLAFAQLLKDLAHELHFQCLIATGAEEALELAQQHAPNAVLLDVGLPDHTGLFVLERLKRDARTRHIPVHVVSGTDYTETALAMGAAGYMLKPVERDRVAEALQNLEMRLTHRLRRVLVVEDDPAQLESLQLLLRSRDVETVGVTTAAECLEQLKHSTFDCMVLDLTLPDSTGIEMLEKLSGQEECAFPPVIIYTGRELTAAEEQRLRRYAKSIIVKGAMSPERLLDEVTLFLHQVVSELPPEQQKLLAKARNRDEVLEGRRILLVEDDIRNVFALTSCLEPRGVKVEIARNGREALEALERASADREQAIDLVLMDIMMPEMDGLAAMREIRKRAEWKKLPIIALTAKAMQQDQENCLGAGANDYLPKPVDVDKLLSLIRVWMPR